MLLLARIVLYTAAVSIMLGGLYDCFVPKLPVNLLAICRDHEPASKLARELLRALGGCLVAIGVTTALLVSRLNTQRSPKLLALILILVLPSEGLNSLCMYRVGSPFLVPLSFALLTFLGVAIAWCGSFA